MWVGVCVCGWVGEWVRGFEGCVGECIKGWVWEEGAGQVTKTVQQPSQPVQAGPAVPGHRGGRGARPAQARVERLHRCCATQQARRPQALQPCNGPRPRLLPLLLPPCWRELLTASCCCCLLRLLLLLPCVLLLLLLRLVATLVSAAVSPRWPLSAAPV